MLSRIRSRVESTPVDTLAKGVVSYEGVEPAKRAPGPPQTTDMNHKSGAIAAPTSGPLWVLDAQDVR